MKAAPVPKRKETSEIIWTALTEMFRRVGLPGDRASIDKYMKQRNWQAKRKWSKRQEEDYRGWLVKFLVREKDEAPTLTAAAILRTYGWEVE